MKYGDFSQFQGPRINVKPEKTIKTVQEEHTKAASEPVKTVIQQSTDSSITINAKTYQLPTTKDIY